MAEDNRGLMVVVAPMPLLKRIEREFGDEARAKGEFWLGDGLDDTHWSGDDRDVAIDVKVRRKRKENPRG